MQVARRIEARVARTPGRVHRGRDEGGATPADRGRGGGVDVLDPQRHPERAGDAAADLQLVDGRGVGGVPDLQRGLSGLEDDDAAAVLGDVLGGLGHTEHVAVEGDRRVVVGHGDDEPQLADRSGHERHPPRRRVRHPHVDAALAQLVDHLANPFGPGLVLLGLADPAEVVVALVRRSLPVCVEHPCAPQRLVDVGRHRLLRPLHAAHRAGTWASASISTTAPSGPTSDTNNTVTAQGCGPHTCWAAPYAAVMSTPWAR